MIKAIYINPQTKKIDLIDIEPEIQAWYDKLNCVHLESLRIGMYEDLLFNEDKVEGMAGFTFYDEGRGWHTIVGPALIMSVDENGDPVSTTFTVNQIDDRTSF